MHCKNLHSACAAAAALLAAGSVLAQPAPTIIVAFSGGVATSVPLDPWTSVAAAALIFLIAATIFRRRIVGRGGRPGLWFIAMAAAASALTGVVAFNSIPDARAVAPPLALSLSTSPASIVVGSGNATVLAQNVTGANITIVSVGFANPSKGQVILTPPTTCFAGLVLPPAQTCVIAVGQSAN